ncbi:MAG: glycosyltransferase family 4 protein [Actinomycetota bacterium]
MPFIVAFCIGVALVPVAAAFARRTGLVDVPGDLKVHATPIPLTGGLAAVAAAVAAVWLVADGVSFGLLAAPLMLLIVGTIDDARPMSAKVRLACQLVAGAILAAGLPLDGDPLLFALTVVVVAASANAVNLIDGQDGLAGGLGACAAIGLALVVGSATRLGGFELALGGGLAGFLVWNRPPAKIFLGNGGAYAVGTLLAAGGMTAVARGSWTGLLAALVCLGLFVFELFFTVARRLHAGDGLTAGDRYHSYDLMALKRSRPVVTLIFWGIAALAAAAGWMVVRLPLAPGVVTIAVVSLLASLTAYRLWSNFISIEEQRLKGSMR